MRVITKIAKNELRNLFYSPIAWFLFVILLVMCAYYYAGTMYLLAKSMNVVYQFQPNLDLWATQSLTNQIFMDPQAGFITNVLRHLYLFVPLLTMNIISREFNSGSVKLLYSSPVNLRKIVWGKFMALAIYNLLLVAIPGIFMLTAFFDIKSLDYPPLLAASLGIYLFLCALTAIGFFMSSLTNYQIVSAIASFTLLFILSRIGQLWQEYDLVRDITYFLSIAGRTEKMQVGLITTRDIIYFLVIIFMFVQFTMLKLKGDRESKPWYIKAARYMVVVLTGLLTGYISSRPVFTGYFDTTALKVNTIHPRTQKILKQLGDSTLEVTLYTNLMAAHPEAGFPAARNQYIADVWEKYQRFRTNIKFNYEYYYAMQEGDSSLYKQFPGKNIRQIAGLLAKMYKVDSAKFKSPEEMRKQINLAPENYNVVMQLKYQGRTAILRTNFQEADWPDEMNFCAAFRRLMNAPMPKVYFITGELERNIYKKGEREFYAHSLFKRKMGSLINIGFDVDTINLNLQQVPADAAVLVLADPKVELSDTVLNRLHAFIGNGGNMLIYGEPGKQYVLNPLLSKIGVQLHNGQIVQLGANETPDKADAYFSYAAMGLAEETWFSMYKYVWDHHVYSDSFDTKISGTAALSLKSDSQFKVTPLLFSKPGKAWLKAGKLVSDSTAPVFNPQQGDIQERSFPLVASFSRKVGNKEQRIIVSGDADFASNMRLIDDWVRAQYSWLVYNDYPIYRPLPRHADYKLKLGPLRAGIQKIVIIWLLPGLVLLTGAILLIRRKRK